MWHYTIKNIPQAPIDEVTIAELIANGTIPANTLVWREGMTDWMPFESSELGRYANPQRSDSARPASESVSSPVNDSKNRPALATNPYAAPQSAPIPTHHVAGSTMTWKIILWSFQGRIPRRTYWAVSGIWIGIIIAFAILSGLLTPVMGEDRASSILGIMFFLLFIPYCWSMLAIQVKRWHDRGKSGTMVLVNLIPFVGGIWAFVECGCLRGTVGANQYGHDPT